MSKAIVIGAGIAGIASALRLRHKGYEVSVFEANTYAGGKLHVLERKGFRFDMGPSLFTMPHLVDELFLLFGKEPGDYFTYIQKEELCRYFWEDGTRFSAKADPKEFVEEAELLFDVKSHVLERYLKNVREKYELTAELFLENSLHKAATFLSVKTLRAVLQLYKLHLNTSLHKVNRAYFKDEKLVQLFDRYATYNGSSPYSTPGIMSMIPHLEMHHGTFFPRGGMHRIGQSLFQLAEEEGVSFHFSEKVQQIIVEKGKAVGVNTPKGTYHAELMVSNMDVYPTYRKLLAKEKAPEKTLAQERSSSALIFYWGMNHSFPELDLHNIFFSKNYGKEFEYIFEKKSMYRDPTLYINISSKNHPSDAPIGGENWFVMVNTPANVGQDWERMKSKCREQVLQKLESILGLDVRQYIVCEEVLDPIGIEERTSSYRGALYGAASNDRLAAFLRHPNFSQRIQNLYFCGGSVHPGGGIPLCLLSAKIVSELIPETI